EFPIRVDASLLVGVALLIAACSRPGSTAGSSALKPIDQAALQTMVDTTAKGLLIPGAVVLLRTPQGEFTVTHGTTLLGAISPPLTSHPVPTSTTPTPTTRCSASLRKRSTGSRWRVVFRTVCSDRWA